MIEIWWNMMKHDETSKRQSVKMTKRCLNMIFSVKVKCYFDHVLTWTWPVFGARICAAPFLGLVISIRGSCGIFPSKVHKILWKGRKFSIKNRDFRKVRSRRNRRIFRFSLQFRVHLDEILRIHIFSIFCSSEHDLLFRVREEEFSSFFIKKH